MAVMNKMRDNMHVVLYALVGAFLLTIVFEWGMNYTGRSARAGNLIGTVNGKPITVKEYDQIYKQAIENYKQRSPGLEITEQMDNQAREQAWDYLVMQTLMDEEIKKLGLSVTDKEIVDVINSDTPPQIIAQQFRDPQTGQINRQNLQAAISDARNKDGWIQVENIVRQERLYTKLQDLLGATVYATDEEARVKFDKQNTKVAAKFVLFELARTKADSLYSITDSDINAYYRDHKDEYKQDPIRSGKFVMFSKTATAADTLAVKQTISNLAAEWRTATSDSAFIAINSDKTTDFVKTVERGRLPPEKDAQLFSDSVKTGTVSSPILEGNAFVLTKIISVKEGKEKVKASHILLQPAAATKEDTAKTFAEAKALMATLKTDADFAKAAREKSKDPGSGQQGGDLGWFAKGAMVKEFDAAVFKAKPGETVGPIKTQFGVHIIKVMAKDSREIEVAELTTAIKPSPATLDRQRKQAEEFQYYATQSSFDKEATDKKLEVRQSGAFPKNGFVPVIGINRGVSDFAFKSKLDAISDVIDTKDGYVVMQLIDANDDGFRRVDENLKQEIKNKIVRTRKLDDLRKMAGDAIAKAGTASGIAALEKLRAGDTLLAVRETGQMALDGGRGFVPGLGNDPKFVAALSALDTLKLSKPIETNRGIALAVLTEKIVAPAGDFDKQKQSLKEQILQEKKSEVIQNWAQALKKQAKIEDNRTQF